MECPKCKYAMIILEYDFVEIDYCTSCSGIWLDSGELDILLQESNNKDLLLSTLRKSVKSNEKKIKCPICRSKMRKFNIGETKNILVDKCINEHGIWFDEGELIEVISEGKFENDSQIIHHLKDLFNYSLTKKEQSK